MKMLTEREWDEIDVSPIHLVRAETVENSSQRQQIITWLEEFSGDWFYTPDYEIYAFGDAADSAMFIFALQSID